MQRAAFVLAVAAVVVVGNGAAWGDDRGVAEQIAHRLQASGQLRGYDVRVKFEDGTACLRGRVATRQQMATALSLAAQTKGVKEVVNGLTVRTEAERRSRVAPIAPRQPVDYAVDRARLVPHSTPQPPTAPTYSKFAGPSAPVPTMTRPQIAQPFAPRVEPLRSLEFSTMREATPVTAQKASFWTSAGQIHVTDLHLATTLAGYAEPMLLPDETGNSGEAFISDEPGQVAASPVEELVEAEPLPQVPAETPRLIQTLPEPARRTWAGGLGEHCPATMRASVQVPR